MVRVSKHERQQGFSLIELLIVLAILGILMNFAMLPFQEMIANQRLKSVVSDLIGDLALARSEAIKRSSPVGISRMTADWSGGWQIFVDNDPAGADVATNRNGKLDGAELVLMTRPAVNETVKICTRENFVAFSFDTLTYSGDGRIRTYDSGAMKPGNNLGIIVSSTRDSAAIPARKLEFTGTGRLTSASSGEANCP